MINKDIEMSREINKSLLGECRYANILRDEVSSAVTAEIPNEETIVAIKEFEEFRKHPEDYKSYSSFKELLDDLNE